MSHMTYHLFLFQKINQTLVYIQHYIFFYSIGSIRSNSIDNKIENQEASYKIHPSLHMRQEYTIHKRSVRQLYKQHVYRQLYTLIRL